MDVMEYEVHSGLLRCLLRKEASLSSSIILFSEVLLEAAAVCFVAAIKEFQEITHVVPVANRSIMGGSKGLKLGLSLYQRKHASAATTSKDTQLVSSSRNSFYALT